MEFYSTKEFSEKIGVHENTLRRWDKSNKLVPHHKTIGGHRVYSQEQVDNYFKIFNNMVLTDILNKFAIDTNNKELQYLVLYFTKETITDMAEYITKAYDKVYDDIPDEYSSLTIAKLLSHFESLDGCNHFSTLYYCFDSDVEFLAKLLGVDSDYLTSTVRSFALDYLKYHNIAIEENV